MNRVKTVCVLGLAGLVAGSSIGQASVNPVANIRVQRYSYYAPVVPPNLPLASAGRKAGNCLYKTRLSQLKKKYDHALKRYVSSKTRTILTEMTPRIKKGMTLSHFFPDYRNYPLVIRRRDGREIRTDYARILTGFYIWKEDDRIVMSSDVMQMSQGTKNRVIKEAGKNVRFGWSFEDYRRVAQKTHQVASSTPFRLDCRHAAELERLIDKVTRDLLARDDSLVISPRTFGRLLTILRGYISFNYYKDLSHDEFDRRFRQLGRDVGRGAWAHQTLTRLLGLHVMGRIERNRTFRKTYEAAITKAAKRHPDVPRKWIEEIIWIETRGDPMTISRAGAYGLMQLMPLVYIGMGSDKARKLPLSFERTINPFNADTNIERGAAFLSKLQHCLKPYMQDYTREQQKQIIFHAYNSGVSRVIALLKKHGLDYVQYLPAETKKYLDKLADFPGG